MRTGPTLHSRLVRALENPRLGGLLCLAALCLTAPSLCIGFYQDDYVARYIYSNLEGARDLYRAYAGGYGISNGVPADNHWQAEAGHAPWWILPELQVALLRPVSQLTHQLDVRFWPRSSVLMHAHSLLWFGALVVATTRLYRRALGAVAGGMAALLFAADHTHGFAVGYIANRHALVAALFGVLCLDRHFRARALDHAGPSVTALILYAAALLSSELSVSVAGYLLGHALFVERGSRYRRGASLLPYAVVTAAWRVGYVAAGYGVYGSGVYIDVTREPLRFLGALCERAPVLLLGQFLAPPAEVLYLAPAELARALWIVALLVVLALVVTFATLATRDARARMWIVGLLISLIPASSTFPHSRQLMFTSIGAMGLLAQFWHLYAVVLRDAVPTLGARVRAIPGALALFGHLLVSPLTLPAAACSMAVTRRFHDAVGRVGDEIAGRDLVLVTAPDYLAARLVQLTRRVEGEPLARRWRALSFGPQAVTVRRTDDRTLLLHYAGGILQTPLSELYRDRRLRLSPGERVALRGLEVRVQSVTRDGRVSSAQFRFDRRLDDPQLCFYFWGADGFAPFPLPHVGKTVTLPAPVIELW